MALLNRCASMSPLEITGEFERYLSSVGASSQERGRSISIAAAVCDMWCFLRDDGQFVASSDCLGRYASYAGPGCVAHHFRRRDIPKDMIENAKVAFGVLPGSDAEFASEWDLVLHGKYFVPFAATLI